ncbi:peptide ABC transporter permease [Paraphotobacterium marinum]|uniref:Peptide ABC transporter permease n=1 Tax=Paraphotobacterium marinum TaxID=1755811 RepID=A0A220VE95_9GAMM|nr:ABC transporter permease subunit [Paraphotobacterium marinum]ASK78620.1 peptide ABC transporter permease [Paraphotobacterium marinum]
MQEDKSVYKKDIVVNNFQKIKIYILNNPLSHVSFWLVIFICFVSIFASIVSPYSPNDSVGIPLLKPSWDQSGSLNYFLGTDSYGRDVFTRIITGIQLTYGYSICVVLISIIVGVFLGVISGMTRGLKSSVINHFLDPILSMPSILIAIIIVIIVGPGEFNVLFAIGLSLIPQFIRNIRTITKAELNKNYVTAAKLDGEKNWGLFKNSLLPNLLVPIINEFTRGMTITIIDISALGFLGLGAQPPSSELGCMIGSSIQFTYIAPWLIIIPGITLSICIFSTNFLSNSIINALNEGIE